MNITLPQLSLVVLVGPSGSGKSTFARQHFLPSEVLSSDYCRGLVSDDENNQEATTDAFDVLHYVAGKRLARGRLTVVDATNVQPEARRPLVALAKEYHVLPVAIVLNLPEDVCHERNRDRADRAFGPHVVRQQRSQLRRGLKALKREGFRHVFVLDSPEKVAAASIERVPLWNDRRSEHGPFDFIGDLHGCASELESLLAALGYQLQAAESDDAVWGNTFYAHPEGRQAVFVGDLVDRGPRVLDCVRIVRNMVQHGSGLCVPGNHDMKLLRKLRGKNVQITHGLAETLQEIECLPEETRQPFCAELSDFLDGLVSHYVLDDGKLVVAHAGMKEAYQGRGSGKVREFALYGETTGETDEFGLPIRYNWAAEYRGSAMVVYGHTPVPEAEWLNHTVNIDTGCVFGGKLTALRYPEREFISIPAERTYCEPSRPFLPEHQPAQSLSAQSLSAQHAHDDVLDAEDVMGKRIVATRLQHNVTIREENSTAALEVMSRFAANPKWLIYLPPTMSPCETSEEPGFLEHPAEAFSYFRSQGVPQVVCQEKHMGSRAVVVVCRDEETARQRFGIADGETGIVYTRTGRRFFNDAKLEAELLDRLRAALTATDFWQQLNTSWACFDCELMPWSAKAQELLRSQYAAVGAAGSAALPKAIAAIEQTFRRLGDDQWRQTQPHLASFENRLANAQAFVTAYRQYCWPVASIDDLKLAPFHLLATEGQTHTSQNHVWHMQTLAKICQADPALLLATDYHVVDVTDQAAVEQGISWWLTRTSQGGEGMVVKPLDWIVRGKKGLVQPAVKCRGQEYLRIIYSPDYDTPENLTRLRQRGLARKRSLALREFALGIEALERFVRREPLRRVHECVFGVLALESEPVDPRL
ncbi:polynucleotide kinase-phosphatase [Blastopirellula marina]|uniref:Polynucleotide kinase-phosphatase n=1 Tax=Blastopirellula marina TaxID=124 RepID=A0A2S8GBU2_9BACT|nr:polynucleotide kinase-phosphatase [Blastopirellula marina]PQO41922.1 polynucleotide kinase-phosphatase [Blastopirellula marina]PTL46280.1 polynucleotide kinase-phosphatase [Blastopirellula marina]